jgi:hypothetical protein
MTSAWPTGFGSAWRRLLEGGNALAVLMLRARCERLPNRSADARSGREGSAVCGSTSRCCSRANPILRMRGIDWALPGGGFLIQCPNSNQSSAATRRKRKRAEGSTRRSLLIHASVRAAVTRAPAYPWDKPRPASLRAAGRGGRRRAVGTPPRSSPNWLPLRHLSNRVAWAA